MTLVGTSEFNQVREREYMISSGNYVKSMANAVIIGVIIGVSLTFKRMINATDLTSMHHMNKSTVICISSQFTTCRTTIIEVVQIKSKSMMK